MMSSSEEARAGPHDTNAADDLGSSAHVGDHPPGELPYLFEVGRWSFSDAARAQIVSATEPTTLREAASGLLRGAGVSGRRVNLSGSPRKCSLVT